MSKKDSVKSSINIFTAIMVVLLTALFAVIGMLLLITKLLALPNGMLLLLHW